MPSNAKSAAPVLDREAIGSRLQVLRNRLGVTQRQASIRLECTESALSKLERGETVPKSQMLLRLSRLYGTTMDYILTGDAAQAESGVVSDAVMAEVEAYLQGYGAGTAPHLHEQLRSRELWARMRLPAVDLDTVHALRRLLEAAETAALYMRRRPSPPRT